MFKRGEMVTICKAALAKGPMNTRQLSAELLKAKGLDASDKVLAKAISTALFMLCGFRREVARSSARAGRRPLGSGDCHNCVDGEPSGLGRA